MSAASDVFAALGGTAGIGAMLYVSVPKAIEAWRGTKRDDADVAKIDAREETARHRIDDGAAAREANRVDALHAQLAEKNEQLVLKAAAEAACLEARKADAELRKTDRRLIRWLWDRMDLREGKRSMPPFPLDEPFDEEPTHSLEPAE